MPTDFAEQRTENWTDGTREPPVGRKLPRAYICLWLNILKLEVLKQLKSSNPRLLFPALTIHQKTHRKINK